MLINIVKFEKYITQQLKNSVKSSKLQGNVMQHLPIIYRINGFSLLELMMVVAIVGILAVVALPSYQSHITQSRRSDAQNSLLKWQLQQERYRISHNLYANAIALPPPVSDLYEFSVSNISATTFTLQAQALEQQLTDSGCTVLSIDQSMLRQPLSCWPK